MKIVASLLLFINLFCSTISAQDKVNVSGNITNIKGESVSQAMVAVEQTSTGVYSDDNGHYMLSLSPRKYILAVSSFGYTTQRKEITVTGNIKLDFVLEEDPIALKAVTVDGKSHVQQLREGSFTVNAIDVKTYASSLNNLNDIIGRSSGVKIREDGGVGGNFDLSINGLSGNAIRYFIDGVPMESIGNGVNLANLPINIVDRVEVYKGVVPSYLGADALGGAINIITKNNVKNYLDVSYGIGSFHTHKVDLNGQYTDPKTGLFVRPTFGLNYSKNDYTMKGVQVPDETGDEFKIVNAKRFHDNYLSVLGQISIGLTNKKWADLLAFTTSYSYINTDLQTGAVQTKVYGMAERENKAYNIGLQYQKKDFLIKRLSSDLSVSHTWDHSIVTDTTFRQYNWSGGYNQDGSRNEITGRDRSIRHIKRPLTIGRANFNYQLNENHSFNVNYLLNRVKNNRSDDIDSDFVPSKDTFDKHIIGLSYSQSFWKDRWTNTFFGKDYISHLKVGQRDLSWITGSDEIPESSTTTNWGYGFSSRFRIYEWLAIKGSAERSVRLPLTREYMGNGSEVYPNFLLKPENSHNYNLGLFGSINIATDHRLFYETNLFYREVKDYIRLQITDTDGTSQYQNVRNVTVKGIEGELRYQYKNYFQAIANISYLDEKNKTKYTSEGKPDAAYNNRIPNRPWLYSNVELNFMQKNIFGKKDSQLKLSYYFQYTHWYYLMWENYGTLASNIIIPTQYINSASLTYSLHNERYNISLECNNMFDRLIYDNYMMQKPGRSFFCKFRLFIN